MNWLQRIGSAIGLGPSVVAAKAVPRRLTSGRVINDQSLWSAFQRIGGSLTPVQVSQIIREADTGEMRRLIDLANDARQKDCHLQSVLHTSEEAIAGLDWELELPSRPTKKEKKAAEQIREALQASAEGAGVHRLIAHQTGARYYGYAVSETVYAKDGRYLVPNRYEHLSARRFGFVQSSGAFVWRDEGMPQSGVDFLALYPDKFIVSRPRVTGDVPCREGLVRVLMWAALFRNWSLSDWLKLGEIAWKPWRLGQYNKDAGKEDIENLEEILETMTASGTATYPDTTKVEIQWPQASGQKSSSHSELFDKMAAEMSKATLGQTLTTEQGKVGSQALGNVQNEVRKDLREASARSVAADLTRDLVWPLTRLNHGPNIRPPRLRFLTEDTADIVKLATGVKTLVEAGVRTIPVSWVHNQGGIPVPEAGEECVTVDVEIEDDEIEPKPAGEKPEPDEEEQEPPKDIEE